MSARTRSCRTWPPSQSCSPSRPGTPGSRDRSLGQVTGPGDTGALIDQLSAGGIVLTYDPDDRTLRAGDHDAPSVTIGKDH